MHKNVFILSCDIKQLLLVRFFRKYGCDFSNFHLFWHMVAKSISCEIFWYLWERATW